MSDDELRPCPFCGSKDIEFREVTALSVDIMGYTKRGTLVCRKCSARGPVTGVFLDSSLEDAGIIINTLLEKRTTEAWNIREEQEHERVL